MKSIDFEEVQLTMANGNETGIHIVTQKYDGELSPDPNVKPTKMNVSFFWVEHSNRRFQPTIYLPKENKKWLRLLEESASRFWMSKPIDFTLAEHCCKNPCPISSPLLQPPSTTANVTPVPARNPSPTHPAVPSYFDSPSVRALFQPTPGETIRQCPIMMMLDTVQEPKYVLATTQEEGQNNSSWPTISSDIIRDKHTKKNEVPLDDDERNYSSDVAATPWHTWQKPKYSSNKVLPIARTHRCSCEASSSI
eukprot:scaffold63059_cov67-Attheya_sp.AAC.1